MEISRFVTRRSAHLRCQARAQRERAQALRIGSRERRLTSEALGLVPDARPADLRVVQPSLPVGGTPAD